DALIGIAQDEAMRQIYVVVVIIARLAIVEAVIGQAMLGPVALQIALSGGGAGALQAACRLALGLLLEIAHLDNSEVAFAILVGEHRLLHLWLDRLVEHTIEEVGHALLQ